MTNMEYLYVCQYDYIDDSYEDDKLVLNRVEVLLIIMLVINDGEKLTIKATINCFCCSGGLGGGGRGQRKPLRAAGVCLQRWEPSFFDHLS